MSAAGGYGMSSGPIPPGSGLLTLTGNDNIAVDGDNDRNIDIFGVQPLYVFNSAPHAISIQGAPATETSSGFVQFATVPETIFGAINNKAVHPFGLNSKIGTQTLYGVPYGGGLTNSVQWIEPGRTGQVLSGNTGGPPSWRDVLEGSNMEITFTDDDIVFTANGGGGGGGASDFPTDDGVAISAGGVLSIFGDPNITTFGSTNVVQVTLNQTISISGDYITTGGHIELPATNFATNAGYIQLSGVPIVHQKNSSSNIFVGGNNAENTTGLNNTAIGYLAANALLLSSNNFFGGTQSGSSLTNAFCNTFVGSQSASSLLTGDRNLILGYQAGINYTTNESNNILLANEGVATDANTMRLGTDGGGIGEVNRTFIAGVSGVNVGSIATVATVAGSGRFGTANIVAGAGVTVTPGPNTITIASTGSGTGTVVNDTWNPTIGYDPVAVVPPTYTIPAPASYCWAAGDNIVGFPRGVLTNASIRITNIGVAAPNARFQTSIFPRAYSNGAYLNCFITTGVGATHGYQCLLRVFDDVGQIYLPTGFGAYSIVDWAILNGFALPINIYFTGTYFGAII